MSYAREAAEPPRVAYRVGERARSRRLQVRRRQDNQTSRLTLPSSRVRDPHRVGAGQAQPDQRAPWPPRPSPPSRALPGVRIFWKGVVGSNEDASTKFRRPFPRRRPVLWGSARPCATSTFAWSAVASVNGVLQGPCWSSLRSMASGNQIPSSSIPYSTTTRDSIPGRSASSDTHPACRRTRRFVHLAGGGRAANFELRRFTSGRRAGAAVCQRRDLALPGARAPCRPRADEGDRAKPSPLRYRRQFLPWALHGTEQVTSVGNPVEDCPDRESVGAKRRVIQF